MKPLKISESLSKEILQYLFAFFVAWLVSSLLMDFPFFSTPIKSSYVTKYFSQFLVGLTNIQLNLLGFNTFGIGNHLGIEHTKGVIFAYGCLGYRYLLFFGVFVGCHFGAWYHKLWYISAGAIFIIWINSLRAIIILLAQHQNPSNTAIVHNVATPLMMFPLILILWLVWVTTFGKPPKKETLLLNVLKKLLNIPVFRVK